MTQVYDPSRPFRASLLLETVPMIDHHIHTKWTDGDCDINEIFEFATAMGMTAITFTEHSSYISSDWFPEFASKVKSHQIPSITSRVGTEVRISDHNGELSISEEVRALCELVVGSVHRFPSDNGSVLSFDEAKRLDVEKIEFDLMIGAIRNRSCDVIGHPFGMSLIRFDRIPSKELWVSLVEESLKHEIALEINSKYHQGSVFESFLKLLIEYNALVSLGSDVHQIQSLGNCAKLIRRIIHDQEN